MIKKVLTTFSMLISSIGFSQANPAANSFATDPDALSQFEAEIKESCGHLISNTVAYNECVEIVSIDFTVFPHNRGGVVCPGQCFELMQEPQNEQ
jgi:hypothetical protein